MKTKKTYRYGSDAVRAPPIVFGLVIDTVTPGNAPPLVSTRFIVTPGFIASALNVALPFEAYTAVASGIDPGRDNVVGTADDQTLLVYSVPRTYPTLRTGHRTHRPDYAFRMSGTYQMPWGLMYASSLNAQSGDYFSREVQIRDALNQLITIRPESQAGRYDWVKIWDNRISKRIGLPRGHSVDAQFDVFNTLNVNTVTAQTNRNGSTYLRPTEIIGPRVARVGLRYRF